MYLRGVTNPLGTWVNACILRYMHAHIHACLSSLHSQMMQIGKYDALLNWKHCKDDMNMAVKWHSSNLVGRGQPREPWPRQKLHCQTAGFLLVHQLRRSQSILVKSLDPIADPAKMAFANHNESRMSRQLETMMFELCSPGFSIIFLWFACAQTCFLFFNETNYSFHREHS